MEFCAEMVIKAAHLDARITEIPLFCGPTARDCTRISVAAAMSGAAYVHADVNAPTAFSLLRAFVARLALADVFWAAAGHAPHRRGQFRYSHQ